MMWASEGRRRLVAQGPRVLLGVAAAFVMLWALRWLFTPHLLAGHHSEYHALRALLVADIYLLVKYIKLGPDKTLGHNVEENLVAAE